MAVPYASLTSLATGKSSKQDLEDAHDEFFRGENREEERQEGSCGGGGQTSDVLESEGDRTHVADHGVAIAEIGERLNIASSEEFLGSNGVSEDPFLFEALDVALNDCSPCRPIS
jgi:hypothetical protein